MGLVLSVTEPSLPAVAQGATVPAAPVGETVVVTLLLLLARLPSAAVVVLAAVGVLVAVATKETVFTTVAPTATVLLVKVTTPVPAL